MVKDSLNAHVKQNAKLRDVNVIRPIGDAIVDVTKTAHALIMTSKNISLFVKKDIIDYIRLD